MTQPTTANATFDLARSVLLLVLVAGVAAALACVALVGLDRGSDLPYAGTAAAAALVGALLALTPLQLAAGKSADRLRAAAMSTMLIRPVVTGLAVTLGVLAMNLPVRPLLLWVAGFYMILLVVEVALISRQLEALNANANPLGRKSGHSPDSPR